MAELPTYLVYVPVSDEISLHIEQFYKQIDAKFHNTYSKYVNGKWCSHIALYNSPMPLENLSAIKQVLAGIATTLSAFPVICESISPNPDGYIFVNFDDIANARFADVHELLVEKLGDLRDRSIKQKYLNKWDSFTLIEQERIRKTGLPYEFTAHTSIAKVEPGEVNDAIASLEIDSIVGKKFTATSLGLLEYDNDVNTILAEFPLAA